MFRMDGSKALVIGVANDESIAWGCARALREQGAELALTYLNEKAEPKVRALAEEVGAQIVMPLDVRNEGEADALFAEITDKWGRLDTLVHSIAFAPRDDLHGRVIDSSGEGFGLAMDISVHALSPGPLRTRAASGLAEFDALLDAAARRAPTHHLATIDDVGAYAAFLASREAFNITGGTHPIDGGFSIVG